MEKENLRKQLSQAGKKGAKAFWLKFRENPEFRQRMRSSWRGHKVNRERIVEAAKLGGATLWRRYRDDPDFKRAIDAKLLKSRSRGGSISLKSLGENGFKTRLENMRNLLVKQKYPDGFGNTFRSKQELRVANVLRSNKIEFLFEPRLECNDHAYYPDFVIDKKLPKIIEVMGIGTSEYWQNQERKLRILVKHFPQTQIAIVTSFSRVGKKHLSHLSRIKILRWSELEELVRWCRDKNAGIM